MSNTTYNHNQSEPKWQKAWEESRLFQESSKIEEHGSRVKSQESINSDYQSSNISHESPSKIYLLFAFAYPSGSGLHVGHVESKTALDILARYYRMNGKDVFFPVGWDAFGLPAENYAIKTGVPPAETTIKAIKTFRRQIKRVGISYDWESEIATSHPEYYKWTQWIFLQLFNKHLAYQKNGNVNWCPGCQTVLANEQVVDGHCERCDHEVIQKEMKQWYFKITDYKDELIEGLDHVDWPKPTEDQQKHWIGRSEGTNVRFKIQDSRFKIQDLTTFTTRVDTIFGVTFLVMAPELAKEWIDTGWTAPSEVTDYVEKSFKKTEEERMKGEKEKSGVDTGIKAINPVNGKEIPIFVADYVLSGYGTGIVMGVPAHDKRDHSFAKKFDLEIVQVVDSGQDHDYQETSMAGDGVLVNSAEFDGMSYQKASKAIIKKFSDSMEVTTTYRLRDWLVSRQRYWGPPIPVVYDPKGNPHPVKDEHLPWVLPTDVEFKPTGESPLKDSIEFKERVEKLYGKGWTPEYDTLDTFVDSSWYFLRYVDSRNKDEFASKEQLKNWLPVDFYMIGPEHIVLHLLYARFITKFLRDEGYFDFDEPFLKMRHQGMILGPDNKKMSKSKGNVIDPDKIIDEHGADALRVYEMFMGPIDADKPWNDRSVVGVKRFLDRVYKLVQMSSSDNLEIVPAPTVIRKLHQTIKKVSEDIPELKFNTAIAMMMEFTNEWESLVKNDKTIGEESVKLFVKTLAPFAPFMTEDLWQMMSEENDFTSIHQTDWPSYDAEIATDEAQLIVVQVMGKVRGDFKVDASLAADQEKVIKIAKEQEKVIPWIEGKEIRKTIYIPSRDNRQGLINFVVN